jgi:hypothetical protein
LRGFLAAGFFPFVMAFVLGLTAAGGFKGFCTIVTCSFATGFFKAAFTSRFLAFGGVALRLRGELPTTLWGVHFF